MSYLLRILQLEKYFAGSNVLQRDCYVILLLAPSQAETTKSARQLEAQLLLLLCSAQSWLRLSLTGPPDKVGAGPAGRHNSDLDWGQQQDRTVQFPDTKLTFQMFNFSLIKLHQNQINISAIPALSLLDLLLGIKLSDSPTFSGDRGLSETSPNLHWTG